MENLPLISKLIGSSLLTLSLLAIAYLSFSASQRLFGKQILSYAISILTLLILISIGFLILSRQLNNWQLDWGEYFAPEKFISELMISVLIVISFVGTRLIINWIRSVSVAGISSLNWIRHVGVSSVLSLNQMLVQWDAGKVSDTIVKKEQILYALRKWIEKENESGWYELNEQIDEKLTDSQAFWMVIKELNAIQQQKIEDHTSMRNHDYEKRLKSLVNIESVGAVWEKWDDGLVSEDVAHEAQEVNSFKKWILNGDETGWIDLQYIHQNRKSLSPKVVELADYELQEILMRKKRREIVNVKIEQRLRNLVSSY